MEQNCGSSSQCSCRIGYFSDDLLETISVGNAVLEIFVIFSVNKLITENING